MKTHPIPPNILISKLKEWLAEDIGAGDVTLRCIENSERLATGNIKAKSDGIFAGKAVLETIFTLFAEDASVSCWIEDGETLAEGEVFARVGGTVDVLLMAERVCLNLLQRLSGIATYTQKYVKAVEGLSVKILDTRKTTPGLRHFEKYAVRVGGGFNHRFGLDDGVLIKDNHIAIGDGIPAILKRARQNVPHLMKIEIECSTIDEVNLALKSGADVILLDNMGPKKLREAVKLCKGKVLTEASGGITLENIRQIAETGVDFISVGALTHSAPVLDISMDLETG